MYYIVRCPKCQDSSLQKTKEGELIQFKCLECGNMFTSVQAHFDEIDTYEIRRTLLLNSRKTQKIGKTERED